MSEYRPAYDDAFLHDCMRIHEQWHERAKSRDTEGLLALYAKDAVLESPLVQAIFDGRESGILHGHREIRRFFEVRCAAPAQCTGALASDGEMAYRR